MDYTFTKKWLKTQPLVVSGYRDPIRGVNLLSLLHLWRECQLDGDKFSDLYPYADEHFRVAVGESLSQILPKFKDCYYLQCWHYGDVVLLPTGII